MANAIEKKEREKQADTANTTRDLARYEQDNFVLNLLAQTYGVVNEPSRYVVHPEIIPHEFQNEEESECFKSPWWEQRLMRTTTLSTAS